MEPNFLILLNFCTDEIITIRLSEEEKQHSVEYDDFGAFMREELEDKYQFNLSDCQWITLETIHERKYNMPGEKGGTNA